MAQKKDYRQTHSAQHGMIRASKGTSLIVILHSFGFALHYETQSNHIVDSDRPVRTC